MLAEKKAKLWQAGCLEWKMHAAQLKIYRTLRSLPPTVRRRVMECARGFGKSYLEVMMALEDCLRPPFNYPVRIIGPELKQCVEIIAPIMDVICRDAPPGLIKRMKSENKYQVGNTQLILGGFNRDYIDKLRGQRAKAIYGEEVRDVDAEKYSYGMKDVLAPMCLHSLGVITELTTTPADESHPFCTDTVPEAMVNGSYFVYNIYENPILTEEQIQVAIKESGGITSPTFRREYLCERVRDETIVVIPNFNSKVHVAAFDRPEKAFYQVVIDMGGVTDKTCAVLVYYDYHKSKKCCWDERVFEPNTSTKEIVKAVREMETEFQVVRYADVPGQIQVDLRTEHAFDISIPPKEDWQANINGLNLSVGNDEWIIHERCKFVRASLESGTFNDKRTDFKRTPTLGHCDGIATMMYANRVINRHNPYPKHHYTPMSETHFERPYIPPTPANAPKKFGTFKARKR
jgi:hypothetical protein